MYTIFIDIDGVLSSRRLWFQEDKNVEYLSKICRKLKACVVFTSEWRTDYSTIEKYRNPQIRELIEKFERNNIQVNGLISIIGNRFKEIEKYVNEHMISSYIILDEDTEKYNVDNIVKQSYFVNHAVGLTAVDVDKLTRSRKKNKIRAS
jgi:hypothetical protein